jgi:hypothetical protein
MGCAGIVCSNVPLRCDDLPFSDPRRIDDSSVAVKKLPPVMARDRI